MTALPEKDGPSGLVATADIRELPPLLTVEELAKLLRLTTKGVYALVESRRIAFVRVSNRVRFLRKDVLAWLQGNRVSASTR
jgi:excisionase family DNA binding protein